MVRYDGTLFDLGCSFVFLGKLWDLIWAGLGEAGGVFWWLGRIPGTGWNFDRFRKAPWDTEILITHTV